MDVTLETYTIQYLLINKKNYHKQEAVHNNYGGTYSPQTMKSRETNKQTKTETNKQNFSLLKFNTVSFILCQKMTILSH